MAALLLATSAYKGSCAPAASCYLMASPASCASLCASCASTTPSRISSSSLENLICTEIDLDGFENEALTVRAAGGCCDEAALLATSAAVPRDRFPPTPAASTSTCCRYLGEDIVRQREEPQRPALAFTSAIAPGDGALRACKAVPSKAARRLLPQEHRVVIVGWMCQVSEALGVQPSTLFTATSILDRFVAESEALPPEGMLQLVALACMSVAVKYDESMTVKPSVWLSLAVDPAGRNLYQPRDLQRCEFALLQTIQWRLHEPNTLTFLEHFLQLTGAHASPVEQLPMWGGAAAAAAGSDSRDACSSSRQVGWDSNVASAAVALAEASLRCDEFLSYEYGTIALACLSLAQQTVGHLCGTSPQLPAAAMVSAAAGLPISYLAPKLAACTAELERCFGA